MQQEKVAFAHAEALMTVPEFAIAVFAHDVDRWFDDAV